MARAIWLTLGKEFRLLYRDPVGLFMLLVAPVVVIAVAGFSLAKIYGGESGRKTEYPIAIVDEDHGAVAAAVINGLARQPVVRLLIAPDRAQAQAMVRNSKQAVVAIVIAAGTTESLQAGRNPRLILYSDPVRYLETMKVELKLGELCRAISERAALEAQKRMGARVAELDSELRAAAIAADAARAQAERAARRTRAQMRAEMRRRIETALADARSKTEKSLNDALAQVETAIAANAEQRRRALEAARDYLLSLKLAENRFEQWFAGLKRMAGSHAAEIPPPPAFPEPPPALESLLAEAGRSLDLAQLKARLAAEAKPGAVKFEMPSLPPIVEIPRISPFPALGKDALPSIPGTLGFLPEDLNGKKSALGGFNIFDLQVPGFAITFLLIGMLMGVSLALIDEHEWGTLGRLRAASAPLSATLIGKMLARFIVGLGQLVILFGVGRLLFNISLGPAPPALLMPCASIAFAAAAFGLVVTGASGSRDAVLPVGAIVIMTMAAIGGCWWPIDFEPKWMQTVAFGLPTTWAMRAFNDLMIRALPASAAVLPSIVNLGFGAVYAIAGAIMVERRFSQ